MNHFSQKFFLLSPLVIVLSLIILFFSQKTTFQGDCGCGDSSQVVNGEFDSLATGATYLNQLVAYQPQQLLALTNTLKEQPVLGENSEEKWIEIDLSEQRLYAYEGTRQVYTSLISSGKWNLTPTGEFRIWAKVKYQRMVGGRKENNTYYNLPNVPFVQYFYKGYGLHGTYWHDNFGQPMSHGCINLPTPVAQELFYWTNPVYQQDKGYLKSTPDNPGTRVVIHT